MAYTRRVRVEWDEAKNRRNRRKHGIAFEQARQLFESPDDYLVLFDEKHSIHEDRFLAVGPLRDGIVVIAWTESEDDTVRIISARWATRRERDLYHARWSRPR